MLIITSADIYFGQHFPMQSETWRSGITCRVAGSLSIILNEASVFFVTLISIDRFICIRFPFSFQKLAKRSVTVTAIILWIFSLALGIILSSLLGRNFQFYDNSHICIGLPLALVERFKTAEIFERIGYDETEYDGYYITRLVHFLCNFSWPQLLMLSCNFWLLCRNDKISFEVIKGSPS